MLSLALDLQSRILAPPLLAIAGISFIVGVCLLLLWKRNLKKTAEDTARDDEEQHQIWQLRWKLSARVFLWTALAGSVTAATATTMAVNSLYYSISVLSKLGSRAQASVLMIALHWIIVGLTAVLCLVVSITLQRHGMDDEERFTPSKPTPPRFQPPPPPPGN